MRNPAGSVLHNYLHTLHTENVFLVLLLNSLTRDETRDTRTDENRWPLFRRFSRKSKFRSIKPHVCSARRPHTRTKLRQPVGRLYDCSAIENR